MRDCVPKYFVLVCCVLVYCVLVCCAGSRAISVIGQHGVTHQSQATDNLLFHFDRLLLLLEDLKL